VSERELGEKHPPVIGRAIGRELGVAGHEGIEALVVLELCVGQRKGEACVRCVAGVEREELLAETDGLAIAATDEGDLGHRGKPSQVGTHGNVGRKLGALGLGIRDR